jgi:hypothetical protein
MLQGGWEFIWTSYALTWIVLGAYGISLWVRFRHLDKREKGIS